MIILLNGPPRSGKDTAVGIIKKLLLHSSYEYKLSKPLKQGMQILYDLHPKVYLELSEDHKDTPSASLYGQTAREAQIALFKCLSKGCGEDVLAKMAIKFIDSKVTEEYVLISDSGRTIETQTLLEHFGYDKVGLIQLWRPGCNFEGDIREYVCINCRHHTKVNNEFELDIFEAQIKKVLKEWNLPLKQLQKHG